MKLDDIVIAGAIGAFAMLPVSAFADTLLVPEAIMSPEINLLWE